MSSPTILLLAGDHRGNLGDKAIVTATAGLLRAELENPRILLAGGGESSYWSAFGVEPIQGGAAGIPRLLAAAKRSDLVLCGGGGLFQDDDSLAKMPYWAARLGLVRPFARRIAGFSIGAGPLSHRSSRLSAEWALRSLDSISVRDVLAQQTLAPLADKPVDLLPDPALLLAASDAACASALLLRHGVPADGRPLIGVAPRRWFHLRSQLVPHKYAARYGLRRIPGKEECDQFVALLAQVLDELIRRQDAHILFLPTYNLAHEGDDLIAASVAERMRSDAATLIRIEDPGVYKRLTERLSLLLTARMHPAILAAAMGTPVVGLAYNQKFRGFLQLITDDARVLDIAQFVSQRAVEAVLADAEALLGKRDLYRDRIAALRADATTVARDILAASGLKIRAADD